MDLRKSFAASFTQLWYSTKELVKKRNFGIKKIVDVIFAVVEKRLKALQTEHSHLGVSLNSVD